MDPRISNPSAWLPLDPPIRNAPGLGPRMRIARLWHSSRSNQTLAMLQGMTTTQVTDGDVLQHLPLGCNTPQWDVKFPTGLTLQLLSVLVWGKERAERERCMRLDERALSCRRMDALW